MEAAQTLPVEQAPVAAGRYVSNVADGTSVTFDVADGEWAGAGGTMVVLDREVAGDAGELIATTFRARVPDPCTDDLSAVLSVQPEPMDAKAFTDWLVAQPWAVAEASETTLGGLPATQVDISALTPACPGKTIFPWLYLHGGPYRLFPTEALRVIAQDRGDDLVLVTAETGQAASLPTFLESAMPVIASMTFGEPIQLASPEPSTDAKGSY
jgi:hypothetical protein